MIEFGNFADLFFLSDILTENNHHGSSSGSAASRV